MAELPQTPAPSVQQAQAQASAATPLPRYKVHNSYIWLGGIRAAFTILVFAVIALFSLLLRDGMSSVFKNSSGTALAVMLLAAGVLIVIAALTFVVLRFSYKHLWYELGPKEFSLYSGILSKKRVHIPYQRVQSVNQRASLIQRIFGVCTVHIDTAGGAQNKAVVVPYLRKVDAEWLRTQLFANKQAVTSSNASAKAGVATASAAHTAGGVPLPAPAGQPVITGAPPSAPRTTGAAASGNLLDAPAETMAELRGIFGGEEFDLGKESYAHRLSNKELFFTGASNNATALVAVVAAIGSIVGLVSTVSQTFTGEQFGRLAVDFVTKTVLENLGLFIALPIIGIILLTWIASIVGTCITYGGFTARRRGSRVEIEYGILQHRFDGVDIDRIQSVTIKQTFIRRLIGYCEISLGKIDALTESQQQNQNQAALVRKGLVVHPFVKMSRVPEILAGLIPEYADLPTELIKLPKRALRRALIRRCLLMGNGFWLAVVVAIGHVSVNLFIQRAPEVLAVLNPLAWALYALCLIILILDGVAAVMWFKRSSFAYNQRFMQISNGGFSFERVSFPKKKIQFGYTKSNPFQRTSRVLTINARTAAGVGGTTLLLKDVAREDAEAWLAWLTPHVRT